MNLEQRLWGKFASNAALLTFLCAILLFLSGVSQWKSPNRDTFDALLASVLILLSIGVFCLGIHFVLRRFKVQRPVSK